MKKLFGILLTLALFTAAPAAAQFNWGIKAGVNIAEKPSNLSDLKSAAKGDAGWYIGPMAKVTLPIVGLGLEANLLYSQTNSEVGGETIKRKCIDLPVYLRYELSLPVVNKFLEPFIAVGPQWSWNIGDKNFVVDAIDGVNLADYTLRSSNLSLNLGLGAVILDHFQIHANYNLALGSTSDYRNEIDGAVNLYKSVKSKTNVWQVSVAYIF
ncbi:MAG: outer membrane beta-barrel protein [Bacteroidaceae bacterium]|nr:outer membrane beta-barrel protein [Bacteroidaceae bacterium]